MGSYLPGDAPPYPPVPCGAGPLARAAIVSGPHRTTTPWRGGWYEGH
jgi:hypothetical protein